MNLPEGVYDKIKKSINGDQIKENAKSSFKEPRFAAAPGGSSVNKNALNDFRKRGGELLGDMGAFANIAIGEASFGLDDHAMGAASAISGGLTNGDPAARYEEGWQNAKDSEAIARDRLGFGAELSADLAGNLVGAPKYLSKALDIGQAFDQGGTLRKLATSVHHEGKKGTVDEMIRGYLAGESIPGMGLDALQGYAQGVVGQGVLGEALPRLAKYGVLGMKSAARVGSDFYNGGMKRDGLTPENVASMYDEISEKNLTVFDLNPKGSAVDDAANNMASIVAKTNFLREGDVTFNPETVEEYAKTMGSLNTILGEANQQKLAHVTDALGPTESRYYRYINGSTEELQSARDTYNSLGKEGPGNQGGVTKPYNAARTQLETDLVALTDSGSITGLPDEYADAYNMAARAMRPRIRHPNAGTTQAATSGDPATLLKGGGQDSDVDLSKVDTTVHRLLAARKEVMKAASPGAVIRGESEKALSAKVASDVAKLLDKQIEETLGSDSYSNARTAYAKYMKTQDANDTGMHFYHSMEDPVYRKSMAEYRSSLDKDELSAFDSGWTDAFLLAMERDGVDATIMNKIGDVDFRDGKLDTTRLKSAGWEQLKSVLGEEKAKTFLETAKDNTEKTTAMKRVTALMELKGYSPDAIDSLTRDGDELLIAAGYGPGQNAILANATIASMQRTLAQYGPREAAFATSLMGKSGDDLVKTLRQMQRAHATPDSLRGGAPMLAAGSLANQAPLVGEESSAVAPSQQGSLANEVKKYIQGVVERGGP